MTMSDALRVHETLRAFVEGELLPGTDVPADRFWASLEAILTDFTPRNAALLQRRNELEARIDAWRHAFQLAVSLELRDEVAQVVIGHPLSINTKA